MPDLGGEGKEWAVERILTHRGSHSDAIFKVQWVSADGIMARGRLTPT